MLGIITSRSTERNALVREQPRAPKESNLDWLARAFGGSPRIERASKKKARASRPVAGAAPRATELLLLGGTSAIDFRLRVAQAHVRHDLSPSRWSHVALLGQHASDLAQTPIVEVSLEPPGGFGFPAPSNGVQEAQLGRYADPARYPNIALLTLPLPADGIAAPLAEFQMQRAALDVPELVLAWLAYAWGVGSAGNPLLSGQGLPSAAMLDRVLGAAQFDLTPGVVERASCPEAIWQAALWWHTFYTEGGRQAPRGVYCAPHKLDGG